MARNRRKGQAPLAAIAANALRRQQKLLFQQQQQQQQQQQHLEQIEPFNCEVPLTPPPGETSPCTVKKTSEFSLLKPQKLPRPRLALSPSPSDASSSEDYRYLPLPSLNTRRKQRGLKTSRPVKVSKAMRGCVIELGWQLPSSSLPPLSCLQPRQFLQHQHQQHQHQEKHQQQHQQQHQHQHQHQEQHQQQHQQQHQHQEHQEVLSWGMMMMRVKSWPLINRS